MTRSLDTMRAQLFMVVTMETLQPQPTNEAPPPLHPLPGTDGTPGGSEGRYASEEEKTEAQDKIDKYQTTEKHITRVLIGIGIGVLFFTCVNVTLFATDHNTSRVIAWLLDPMVSAGLIAVLVFDGKLSALGNYKPSGWVVCMRYFTFLSTWLMNSWSSLYPEGFTGKPTQADPAGLILHSTPPVLLFIMAEASTQYRKEINSRVVELQEVIDSYLAGIKAKEVAEEQEALREAEEEKRREEQKQQLRTELENQREQARLAKEKTEAEAAAKERERKSQADLLREQARIQAEKEERQEERERKRREEEEERRRREADDEARRQIRIEREKKEREEAEAARARVETGQERRQAASIVQQKAEEPGAQLQEPSTEEAEPQRAESQGAVPREPSREELRAHKEAAVEYAAKLILRHRGKEHIPMTTAEFGEKHGMKATWGRQRLAEAEDRLQQDTEFLDRMKKAEKEAAALEKMVQMG